MEERASRRRSNRLYMDIVENDRINNTHPQFFLVRLSLRRVFGDSKDYILPRPSGLRRKRMPIETSITFYNTTERLTIIQTFFPSLSLSLSHRVTLFTPSI